MADNDTDLPEGTDKVIAGASGSPDSTLVAEREPASAGHSRSRTDGLADRLRSSTDKLSSKAGEKARGLVGQGLERSAEALANVSKLVGESAPGIEERLGPEYGDYARRAASAIENAANTIAEKDPDELLEDTREFVRNSPGLAIAGAAIVGFVLARVLKTGLARDADDAVDGDDDES